jgi:serine O-acetyltransferase
MFEDVKAIYRNDPAARGLEFLLYPGLHAVTIHRCVAHPLYKIGLRFMARLVSQVTRFLTGIEIHPGAVIGSGCFIDHGIGIVIGETARIGKNCLMYHGVTLGGTGNVKGPRHPIIGDNVMIGAQATILGLLTIGDGVKVGAETFIINRDVPAGCTIVGAPARIVKKGGTRVNEKPPKHKGCHEFSQ